MRYKRILAGLIACLALSGCGSASAETDPSIGSEPLSASVCSTETAAPSANTESAPALSFGAAVTTDGAPLESGSVIYEGDAYVKAGEFLASLDNGQLSGNDQDGYTLRWENGEKQFRPGEEATRWNGELWLPLEETCEALEVSLLEDPEENRVYCTSGISHWDVPKGIRVPVLMYHAVDSNTWGHEPLFVDPEVMEAHLQYLVENGYDPIFFEDLNEVEQYDKPVIITFDDGYVNNYTNLYPLLEKYQVKATIFVVTSSIRTRETSMSVEQVKELSDSGLVSIQSHTVNHSVLRDLTPEEQDEEMRLSKLEVARMTGREPFVFSYPTGAYNRTTLKTVKKYYDFAVTVEEGDYISGVDPYEICRYYVRRTTTMEEFMEMLENAGDKAHWPYLG